ncbi:MAG TPA: hypothetical protein VF491_08955 [Vicinamibacterales bacterium]
MATIEGLTIAIDQVITYFNARRLDLPDGLFDRKTQFVLNGAAFETLLSSSPNDPLVLMLARGPAGFRFTAKALQHAIPNARVDRGEIATDGDPFKMSLQLWLSGTLRGTGDALNALVNVTLRLASTGHIDVAEALIDARVLDGIRQARLKP